MYVSDVPNGILNLRVPAASGTLMSMAILTQMLQR